MSDENYLNDIYFERGGSKQVFKAGGAFEFYGESASSTKMRSLARAGQAVTLTNLSTASTTLSTLGGSLPAVLYSEYGTIYLSLTGTGTNLSARLPSAYAGQVLWLVLTPAAGGSTASVLIYCEGHASGITGAEVLGSTGSALSTISIRQSAASFAKIKLEGIEDGTWAITQTIGTQVTEATA